MDLAEPRAPRVLRSSVTRSKMGASITIAERRTKARVILVYLIVKDEVAMPVDHSILQPGRRGQFI